MKVFSVGDVVYRLTVLGDEEGRVVSFSRTGASMRVEWQHSMPEAYRTAERDQLLTPHEIAKVRDRARAEREARTAKEECQSAIRRLFWALGDAPPVGGDPLHHIRHTTERIVAMTQALTAATKGQS